MNATKIELCNRVSKKIGKSPLDIKSTLEGIIDEILSIMSEGKRIEIRGFGVFKIREKKDFVARNPRTGDPVTIKAHKAPVFKFSKDGIKNLNKKLAFQSKSKEKKREAVARGVPNIPTSEKTVSQLAKDFSIN